MKLPPFSNEFPQPPESEESSPTTEQVEYKGKTVSYGSDDSSLTSG